MFQQLDNRNKNNLVWKFIRTCSVFGFVLLAWTLFRVQNISEAIYAFGHSLVGIGNPVSYINNTFSYGFIDKGSLLYYIGLYLLPLATFDYISLNKDLSIVEVMSKKRKIYQWIFYLVIALMVVIFIPKGESAEFVYFQF